jgi:hypothetical protein
MATTHAQESPTKERTDRRQQQVQPLNDLMEHVREYAREKPEAAALWCLGIGFVLGWKLKPW